MIERMKMLLDSESQEIEGKGVVVPHNIKLKVQWDKFATDSDDALTTLENELLIAAADHINDKLYYTKAPLAVEVKPDYFTEGVKLFVSFDRFTDEESDPHLNLTMPGTGRIELPIDEMNKAAAVHVFIARFTVRGSRRDRRIELPTGGRLSIGRISANDLVIDDGSISKTHASIVVDADAELSVADTGSTNGTFVSGERIAYGKAIPIKRNDWVRFGMVDVLFEYVPPATEPAAASETQALGRDTVKIGGFEFASKVAEEQPSANEDDKTLEIDENLASEKKNEEEG